jgi:hypothetical protein
MIGEGFLAIPFASLVETLHRYIARVNMQRKLHSAEQFIQQVTAFANFPLTSLATLREAE